MSPRIRARLDYKVLPLHVLVTTRAVLVHGAGDSLVFQNNSSLFLLVWYALKRLTSSSKDT